MDQVPKLGQLIKSGDTAFRDAVHVAVAPVTAGENLEVAQGVELDKDMRAIGAYGSDFIGIVDPFLTASVKEGERFWLFLSPGTVTSLRHLWSHPSFKPVPPHLRPGEKTDERQAFLFALAIKPDDLVTRNVFADWLDEHGEHEEATIQRNWTAGKQQAIEWLTVFADRCGMSYSALIRAAEEFLDYDQYHSLSFNTPACVYDDREELWKQFNIATGRAVPEGHKQRMFISCSC